MWLYCDLLWLPWPRRVCICWVTWHMIAARPVSIAVLIHPGRCQCTPKKQRMQANEFLKEKKKKKPKSWKCRLWSTLGFWIFVVVIVGFFKCVCATPATIGSVDLEIAEFQIKFITGIKSSFLAVDFTCICLFHLASGKLGGPSCIGSSSQAYCIWGPACESQVVTVGWMSKSNIWTAEETGS